MEKIYIVSHLYDNGEMYEYYKEYEEKWYYSTLECAFTVFSNMTRNDFEGCYTLEELTLDTQESVIIEQTPYYSRSMNPYGDDYEVSGTRFYNVAYYQDKLESSLNNDLNRNEVSYEQGLKIAIKWGLEYEYNECINKGDTPLEALKEWDLL